MPVAASGDALYLGRLIVSVQRGELMLIATWWELHQDMTLYVSEVLDVRDVES